MNPRMRPDRFQGYQRLHVACKGMGPCRLPQFPFVGKGRSVDRIQTFQGPWLNILFPSISFCSLSAGLWLFSLMLFLLMVWRSNLFLETIMVIAWAVIRKW